MVRTKVQSSPKDEYEVEYIGGKRFERGRIEYYVKWVGYPESDNSWVAIYNLHCPKLVTKYEKQEAREKNKNCKNLSSGSLPLKKVNVSSSDKSRKLLTRNIVRRLKSMKIVRATKVNGEVKFVVACAGTDKTYVVSSKEAKLKCPQLVIDFYEEKLTWQNDPTLL